MMKYQSDLGDTNEDLESEKHSSFLRLNRVAKSFLSKNHLPDIKNVSQDPTEATTADHISNYQIRSQSDSRLMLAKAEDNAAFEAVGDQSPKAPGLANNMMQAVMAEELRQKSDAEKS